MTDVKKHCSGYKAIVIGLGVLVGAIAISMYYGDELQKVSWRLVALVCLVAVGAFGVYRWNERADNDYDILDLVMNEKGRADLEKHLIVFFAAISAWAIVQQVLAETLSTELLLGVLGIFVAKQAAQGFSDAIAKRPAPEPPQQVANVMQVGPATAVPEGPLPKKGRK